MPPSSAGDRTTTTSRATWANNARVLRQEMPVFLQGRRAFFIIPTPPTSPLQPLISPPRHRFGPCLPAPRLCVPRLFVPRLPRCGCPAAAAVCHSYSLLASHAAAAFGHRSATRPAHVLLSCPEHRTDRPLLQFCLERRHGPCPFSCPSGRRTADSRPSSARGTKKADGTAQRSVRRQKATNLSRQHHRGRSSTRQVSARA